MTKKGVWGLQQVRDEYLEGNWTYSSSGGPYSLYSMGVNSNGELSTNDRINRSSPTQIPGTWISAGAGVVGSGIKIDNTLWSWGYNSQGGLGINDKIPRSSPVQVPGTQWKAIVQPNNYYGNIVAFKTDGTLWAWGLGTYGQLGLNDVVSRSSPVQVPGTWSTENGKLIQGGIGVMGLKTDGTLWTWGGGTQGRLGLSDIIPRSSPVQIPGTTWSTLSASYYAACATKTDGTMWVWGYNAEGSLAQVDNNSRSSPVQIPGNQWNEVSSGSYYNFLATKTDGTLWTWGYNANGSLGLNDIVYRSSPVQIPGTQWTKPMRYGGFNSSCQKTDGTLWTWGHAATAGSLGLNDIIPRSSPVQLPGTQWTLLTSHRQDSTLLLELQ